MTPYRRGATLTETYSAPRRVRACWRRALRELPWLLAPAALGATLTLAYSAPVK